MRNIMMEIGRVPTIVGQDLCVADWICYWNGKHFESGYTLTFRDDLWDVRYPDVFYVQHTLGAIYKTWSESIN